MLDLFASADVPAVSTDLVGLGVGGTFVLLVLRSVFDIVKASRSKGDSTEITAKTVRDISRKMEDLHSWHSVTRNGLRVWDNSRVESLLEQVIELLRHNARVDESTLKRMAEQIEAEFKRLRQECEELNRSIKNHYRRHDGA